MLNSKIFFLKFYFLKFFSKIFRIFLNFFLNFFIVREGVHLRLGPPPQRVGKISQLVKL